MTNEYVSCFHFRYILNIVASAFVTLGSLFDIGVWYYVDNLKIFDEEENNNNDNKVAATNATTTAAASVGMEMKGPLDNNGRLSITTIATGPDEKDEKEKERH